MSVDTEITGQPASVSAAATWLRDRLATELKQASDRLNEARRDAQSSWDSEAGGQFAASMTQGRNAVDDLERAARKMGEDLDDFAGRLRACQDDMQDIRSEAAAAGLSVSGFVIADPGPGPARPPDGFVGTEAEVAAHHQRVAAYDAHQQLILAYQRAAGEAARIDRQYATACRDLQEQYTPGQHASWIVTVGDVLGSTAEAALGVSLVAKRSKLYGRAGELLDDAKRAIDDLQSHPERYLKRRWLFFRTLDEARLDADRLAIQGKLDDADELLRRSSQLDEARLPRYLGRAGKVLGPLGIGLGVYNDYQEGESNVQIAVSQGGSALAGIGAGAATGAAVGATVGSVFPGVGTVVGAGVGTIVGAGVAIFTDGAIDSLFENGPDVGEAFDAGVDALEDTGSAIVDGVSSVGGAIGGLFG